MTGAPMDVKAGDKVYKLSPLTISALGAIERWCQDYPFQRLNERVALMPGLFATETLRAEMDRAHALANDKSAKFEIIESVAGACFVMLQRLLPNYPDATLADAEAIVQALSREEMARIERTLDGGDTEYAEGEAGNAKGPESSTGV
jgi:hypothetical protein